eukprot:481885-Prymnesium_polylepis.1
MVRISLRISASSGGPSLYAAAAYFCASSGPESRALSDWTLFHVSNSSRQAFHDTTDLSPVAQLE